MLRRIFGLNRVTVTRDWRELHNDIHSFLHTLLWLANQREWDTVHSGYGPMLQAGRSQV
jgi:hypothetical protein